MSLCKSKRQKGFSLVETVVVLGLVVGLILIPLMQTRNLTNMLEKRQTVNTFKSNFNNGTKHAVVTRTTVTIRYYKPTNIIYFYYADQNGEQINRMPLPKEMKIVGLKKDLVISKTGSVAPKTITFKTKNWQKSLKIQMKWGQLIETD